MASPFATNGLIEWGKVKNWTAPRSVRADPTAYPTSLLTALESQTQSVRTT